MSEYLSQPSWRSNLLRALGTILALALLIYLLAQQGWQEIIRALQQIPSWLFGLALVVALLSRVAVSARWHVLLRASGMEISFWQSVRITLAGLFASNFLPTTIGGDVIRLAGAIQMKYDAATCAASLVVDRLVGMTGMAMVLPLGLPSLLALNRTTGFKPAYPLSVLGISRWGWAKKLHEFSLQAARKILNALALWLKQPRSLLASLGFSWVHMLCLYAIIYLLFAGMGKPVSVWSIAGLYSLVYFVTLIPISINGYGLQEVSMTFIFSSLAGVSVSVGLTAALLFRTILMLASLPGVAFVPGLMAARGKQAPPS